MSDLLTISLAPTQAATYPGGRVELTLSIENHSQIVDRYRIEATGVPEEWRDLETVSVPLFPGDKKQVRFSLSPPEGLATNAGTYPITITATSEAEPLIRESVEFSLIIQPTGTVEFDLSPKRVTGKRARFEARIRNLT